MKARAKLPVGAIAILPASVKLLSKYYPPVAADQIITGPNVRCEKWCGGGERTCSKQRMEQAEWQARKLARALGQHRFRPVTNHNMGWFASAVSECRRLTVTVHEYRDKTHYSAYLGDAGMGGGLWVATSFQSPQAAVREVIRQGQAALKRYKAIVEGLPEI